MAPQQLPMIGRAYSRKEFLRLGIGVAGVLAISAPTAFRALGVQPHSPAPNAGLPTTISGNSGAPAPSRQYTPPGSGAVESEGLPVVTPVVTTGSLSTVPTPPPAQERPLTQGSMGTRESDVRVIRRVATARPHVALTIDDGWSHRTEILQLLVDRQVPAVFFLTAKAVSRDTPFMRNAVAKGFEIGNHTTSHPDLSNLSTAEIAAELAGLSQLYATAVGADPPIRFFRAPYGALSSPVLEAAAESRYQVIQWDVTIRNQADLEIPELAQSVIDRARPGSIILGHFTARCAAVLPQIIAGVRANGLEFVALDTLLREATRSGASSFPRR